MKKIVTFLILISGLYTISAQSEYVYIYFNDKPNAATYLANPLTMLSQKSLDRRSALGISLTNQDAPIEASYIQQVANLGITIESKSKWFNAVAATITSTQKTQVLALPCVNHIESFVKNVGGKHAKTSKFQKFQETYNIESFSYGAAATQVNQINLATLHNLNYSGTGIDIAVLDTGFPQVNTGNYFARIRDNNQIKGVFNIISDNTDAYNTSLNNHGTMTLSTIAAYNSSNFAGTAPDANFWLFATEIGSQEIPEEESYWIEAAEKADSCGVRIISSSLGYADFFDDSRYNYNTSQMDGVTSFISRGAKIACDKGIIVVNSAGNEGDSSWHYIIAPADVTEVLTLGAVNSSGNPADFSSFGPTSDGRIKPDVSTLGEGSAVSMGNSVISADGTSFSCPIMSGAMACLVQAFPTMQPSVLRDKIRQCASLYPSHTNQLGYGIPNIFCAYQNLKIDDIDGKENSITIFPNPTADIVKINTDENHFTVKIYDISGKYLATYQNQPQINMQKYASGIYLFSILYNEKVKTIKVIKK